jgi:hypothetical protein
LTATIAVIDNVGIIHEGNSSGIEIFANVPKIVYHEEPPTESSENDEKKTVSR